MDHQKYQKINPILVSDAVANPDAMMIKLPDAVITEPAMLGPRDPVAY